MSERLLVLSHLNCIFGVCLKRVAFVISKTEGLSDDPARPASNYQWVWLRNRYFGFILCSRFNIRGRLYHRLCFRGDSLWVCGCFLLRNWGKV